MYLKKLAAGDPARVGPYRLVAVLGSGGMGHVYLGRSPGGRAVAVKMVRPELSEDEAFLVRFRREVKAARSVSGVFTSPVIDANIDGGAPWLATAYIAGPPLSEAVRVHGPLEEPVVRGLGAALAEALCAVHGAGLVHRDLNPANVLLAEDGPKVIDFGISRALDGTAVTRSGTLVGSPAFMAPEQVASGRSAGPAADVFALGGTLVYAATGTRPFGTGTVPAVLARIVDDEPRLDGVPAALRGVVAECLDKDPGRRPSPKVLVERLGGAAPEGWWPPPVRAEISVRAREAAAMIAAPPGLEGGPEAVPRYRRRRVLLAAGTAGAAGGAAWLVRGVRSRGGPSADPAGPRPLWTYAPDLTPVGAENETVVLRTAMSGDAVVLGEGARLTCLDASTGARRWEAPIVRDTMPSVTGVIDAVHISGDTVYTRDRGKVVAYDIANGKRRWQIDRNDLHTIDGSTMYVLETISVLPTSIPASSTRSVYEIRAAGLPDGRTRWRYRVSRPAYPDPTITIGAGCCLVSVGGTLDAVDPATGERQWQTPIDPYLDKAMKTSGSTVLIPKFGSVTAIDGGSGAELWTAGGFTREGPGVLAATPDVVCVGDGKTATGLDARTGTVRWRTPLPAPPTPSTPPWPRTLIPVALTPGMDARMVDLPGTAPNSNGFAGLAENAGLAVLDPATGRPRWTHAVPGETSTRWEVRADDARVYAYDGRRLHVFRGRG